MTLVDKNVGKAKRMACVKTWRHPTTWCVGSHKEGDHSAVEEGRVKVRLRIGKEDVRAGIMMEGLGKHARELGLFCFALRGVEPLMCYNQNCVTSVLSF